MAELAAQARASAEIGSGTDAVRWKAHALDALTSAAATVGRLPIVDATSYNQLHELALRLSML